MQNVKTCKAHKKIKACEARTKMKPRTPCLQET